METVGEYGGNVSRHDDSESRRIIAKFYRQEIITGLEGCLLDLIDQSMATNSALCVAFLAALIDTSASTHALGQHALTESVNNFQVRHRIDFSALDLIYFI